MKVLNFGSCNIDFVYSTPHIVRAGETLLASRLDQFAGGKGLNQSVAIARAGADVYHAGCIGTDGGMLRELLRESGANVTYLRTVDCKCGHAIIQLSPEGENSIVIYAGANAMVTQEYIDEVLSHFSACDMLVLQNEISNVDYLVRRAYERGMKIMLNPSPFNESLLGIDYSMLTYLILNETEASEITGKDDVDGIISFFREKYPSLKVIFTIGSRGCIYFDSDTAERQSAFIVEVKDTTAAGDTFTGYFVASIARGEPVAKALRIASAAAAISVSRSGAAPSIPTRHEVMSAIGSMKLGDDTARNERVMRITERYFDEHLTDARLDELSAQLGYSVIYTGHLVSKAFGLTFSQLLQDKRCTVAHELLLTTELSVSEIVRCVGYENESFFRKMFKKKYGDNPKAYRKMQRNVK